MTVVTLCANGEEQCFLGETQRPAVCQYPADVGIVVSDAPRSDERRDFFYCVLHTKLQYLFLKCKITYSFSNGKINAPKFGFEVFICIKQVVC